MLRFILIIILSTLLLFSTLLAQNGQSVSKVGMTAASFLEIGAGARAIGMGGAFVGTANDASALYWNPGGISRLSRAEVILVHTEWLADLQYEFAGAVLPLNRFGTLGFSLTALHIGEMKVTTIDYPQGTGELFSANDLSLAVSYGISLTDRFSIGFTGKYIHQQIWKESAQGMALDIGTLFITGFHNMRIGASLTNFGTDMRMAGDDLLVYYDLDPNKMGNNERTFAELKTDSWPLPLTFQAGIAIDLLKNEMNQLTLAIDAVHPSDNTESLHIGVEYGLHNWFFLRGGYRDLFLRDTEGGLTLGGGVIARFLGNFQVKVDYAYADFGRLENVHRFSMGIIF
ncbi:PorV/PorQ family protein [candidate division KSB1 bacterium]|nr:PorV/PorQ family protein [candidate division KSB1 bacterium]